MGERRKIMIVGNGETAQGATELVDAADFVVRFNDCRSTETSGSRADAIAVCNTGRPAKWMLSSPEWLGNAAVLSASEIWSVRDPRKFSALRGQLALSHPELDDFCDDYTDEFAAFAENAGKTHMLIDQTVHDAVDQALKAYEPEQYVVPSSGMIVIADMLARLPDDDIVIAGFGHAGWPGHPFEAEKRLVESYISAGRLRRMTDGFSFSSSQGA